MSAEPSTPQTQTTDRRRESASGHAKIRLTNVVPLLVIAAVVVGALAATWPGFRAQLASSFAREPERFLTIYFTDEIQASACAVIGGKQEISATIYSELASARDLEWTVSIRGSGGSSTSTTGTVATQPGEYTRLITEVPVPKEGAYRVNLELQGRPERLALNCKADS